MSNNKGRVFIQSCETDYMSEDDSMLFQKWYNKNIKTNFYRYGPYNNRMWRCEELSYKNVNQIRQYFKKTKNTEE